MSEPATKNPFAVPAEKQVPAAIQASAQTPATQVTPTAGPVPTETRAIGLLIHRSVDEASQALATTGPARAARIDVAAQRMTAALGESCELSRLGRIEWQAVVPELASLASVSRKLLGELVRVDTLAEGVELTTALDRFTHHVDRQVWQAVAVATLTTSGPTTEDDQFELALVTIGATRKQVAIATTKTPNESEAVVACAPLHLHLAQAADASLRVTDRSHRLRLTIEIDNLAVDMEALGRMLKMPPQLRWHAEFASAFDAENALRHAVGMNKVDRPYYGQIDPAKALEAVHLIADNAKTGTNESGSKAAPTDPESAISLIKSELLDGYQGQHDAITTFDREIQVEWPASTGWLQTIMEFVLDTAVNIVTDGIAGKVGSMVTKSMTQRAAKGVEHQIPTHLTGGDRAKAIETAIEPSAAARTAAGTHIKAGVKSVLSKAAKAGLDAAKAKEPASVSTRGYFVEKFNTTINGSRTAAIKELIVLTPALAQLDLDTLVDLAEQMSGMQVLANDAMLTAAITQWENLKAQNARPTSMTHDGQPFDPNLNAPNVGPYGDEAIPGVLEVGVRMAPAPELAYLVLRDGEPFAVQRFKSLHAPIASLGLNRQYQFSFDGLSSADPEMWRVLYGTVPAAFVKLGVGVRHGLQVGTLSPAELLMLKIYRAGLTPNAWTKLDAQLTHRLDNVSDAEAIATANALIRTIDRTTTSETLEH